MAACASSDEAPRDEKVTAVSAATGATTAQAAEFDAPGAELGSPAPRASSEAGPLVGSQPLDVVPEDGTRMAVTEVRTASHGGVDRIVVELDGTGAPGWHVSTDISPTAAGSGLPISYGGDTALLIDVRGVVSPTAAPSGPDRVHDTAGGVVRSVGVQGVFEGVQRIVVGLGDGAPTYRVSLLDSPTRIVVDVTRPE
jgi:hypothetical protein